MKKYIKPEIIEETISAKDAITALTISTGKAVDYDNAPQDSWSSWEELF